jgi:hypothetical protein
MSGVLEGFDRLRLRGTLRQLYRASVMEAYLNAKRVLIKDFGALAERTTESVKAAAGAFAERWQRPVEYVASSQRSKEELAREIARRDGIEEGLIAVLTAVEPCKSFAVVGDPQTREIGLQLRLRKCLHYYFYFAHARFGFMHVRLQSWFPFQVDICLNGRHWLARQLDAEGIAYCKHENAFHWVEDFARAQALLDAQAQLPWQEVCNALIEQVHPTAAEICRPLRLEYYWTFSDSEYATDLIFKDPADLARIYPSLVHHALRSFGAADVMRFLGRPVPAHGHVSGHFKGEIISDLKHRPEGLRVKHSLDGNSLKLYDKHGRVLRVETTIPRPDEFMVWRGTEKHPEGPKEWRRLRRGVADVGRRVEVSRAANQRYLKALAATTGTIPLFEWTKQTCRPVRFHGRRYRALNPLAPKDAVLLEVINRGEWNLRGFRNAEVRALLFPARINRHASKAHQRRAAAAVRRHLSILRAHGLVRKIGRTHRYVVTDKGRQTITALLAVKRADVDQLTKLAA